MLDRLVGMRVTISIDEPTSYVEKGTHDLGAGTIRKVAEPKNSEGHPYDIAIVVLDKPFEELERGHGERLAPTVFSMTNLFTIPRLEDLLTKGYAPVHLSCEDPRILELDAEDPRFRQLKSRYIGWATVRAATIR